MLKTKNIKKGKSIYRYILLNRDSGELRRRQETRKIQYTGSSSFIVSLPKKWVQELGIRNGDSVIITRRENNILEIIPSSNIISKEQKEAIIEVRKDDHPHYLARKLISLYFLGFNIVNIFPIQGGRLSTDQRAVIKEIVRNTLIGTEIVAESAAGITLQVLINLLDLSMDAAFKRMLLITKSMHKDAILALREFNTDIAREVVKSDDEVDRFSFYIIRQLIIAIRNEHLLKEIGLDDSSACLGYRLIAKSIERIADHATKIANTIIDMKVPLEKEMVNKISEMSNFAMEVLDEACLSMFKRDYNSADEAIEKVNRIYEMEKDIIQLEGNNNEIEIIYRIKLITENIKRVAEYATDIAECVLNMTVEKTIKKNEM